MEGIKISRIHLLDAAGIDRKRLALNLIHCFCKQIFEHGEYHADPHPGNIMVRPDGRITLLDFGAVSRVSPRMRQGMVEYLQAALNQNTPRLVEAMRKMGFVAAAVDDERFEELIAFFQAKLSEQITLESFNLREIKVDPTVGFELLAELRSMKVGLRELGQMFRVPREWILLERTVILLTGLCTLLDPELQPMPLIRPYVERFVLGDDRDWSRFALDTGRDWVLQVLAMPGEIRKVLGRASAGKTRVRLAESREIVSMLGASARLIAYGVVTSALVIAASIETGRPDGGSSALLYALASVVGLLFAGAAFGIRRRMR